MSCSSQTDLHGSISLEAPDPRSLSPSFSVPADRYLEGIALRG
ncbi:hypothetical protein J3T91_04165 [Bifidobacterium sp. B4001]|nr:hypothetical protein [Bifidobacterium sp. B4079]MCX8681141.1 hypothetical protein [Bifidobacterium sp. B4001]